jgi:O-acetyl-ADP-ribose deacetylase (regulator of RNase III)
MELILVSQQEALAQAWERYCGDVAFVRIYRGSILDVECDAVVSPANSFGFMNGGIDLLYSQTFGWDVQKRLQQVILEHHNGELLVGSAEVVDTGHPSIPWMIAAPTMRMPMTIRNTVNPYLAARAVFLSIQRGTLRTGVHTGKPVSGVISTVAMPGLGTGVGRVDPEVCSRQVRAAIDQVLLGRAWYPEEWGQVLQQHEQFLGGPVEDN